MHRPPAPVCPPVRGSVRGFACLPSLLVPLGIGCSALLSACSIPESKPFENDGAGDLVDGSDGAEGAGDGGDGGVPIEWDEACNPLNLAGDCLLPWPSDMLTVADASSETGRRYALTATDFVSPDGPLPADPSRWDYADGASPTSPILVHFGVDVDPAQLSTLAVAEAGSPALTDPIVLLRLSDGAPVRILTEMDQNARDSGHEGRHALIIRPLEPLAFGERYAVALREDLRGADGAALPRSAPFDAWRDGVITDSDALEALRPEVDALLGALEGFGLPRAELRLAWAFTVKSEAGGTGLQRDMRAQAYAQIADDGVPYVIDAVVVDPSADVAALVRGRFQPPLFLNADNNIELDGYGAVLQSDPVDFPFTLVVPAVARERRGLPLAIIGHGIFGRGDEMLSGWIGEGVTWPLSNELGAVLLATDWIGLSGGDLDLIIDEVVPDLGRINLVTDRLAQSQINALSLVELGQGALTVDPALDAALGVDRSGGAPAPLVLDGEVYYYGVSLGGVQGSTFVSLCPEVDRAVLAVPGAGWGHMIQRSTHFREIALVINALYPDPLSQLVFISMMQHDFDRSDPAANGALLGADPDYPDRAAPTVILQEGIGDVQVPNLATNILARRLGAAHLEVAGDTIGGLSTTPSPAVGAVVLTAVTLPENLADYTPPESNLIPERDNNVHG
ncbi:MAG: hypothetical protein RL071_3944, partial [Pseudomonadota bacterium]